MSNHNVPLTGLERDGLVAHGLGRYIGKPSQLADVFRSGVAWAIENHRPPQHDTPEVVALKAERDAAMKDAERYRWLTTHARTTSEHWGGRWSIVIDGPAPERHGCKDALDEAIDAAIAKMERDTAR